MLVLRRKVGESIVVSGKITITINRIEGNRVSLGIEAPADVHILRGELQKAVEESLGLSESSLAEPTAEEALVTASAPAPVAQGTHKAKSAKPPVNRIRRQPSPGKQDDLAPRLPRLGIARPDTNPTENDAKPRSRFGVVPR